MKRGRKPGKGIFAGGRKKGVPNKKGSFDSALPPSRCFQWLRDWVDAMAKRQGISSSEWLRVLVEDAYNNAHEAEQSPPSNAEVN